MEAKISVKKNAEISFSFDNQKREPNTKENSKLQAKVTVKFNLISKLTLGPTAGQPQSILLEINLGNKMPTFWKQMRTNATVKKPKWTQVANTEGYYFPFNSLDECGFIIKEHSSTIIKAYTDKRNLVNSNGQPDMYRRISESFQKLKETPGIGILDIRDFDHQPEIRTSLEETKLLPTNTAIKIEPIHTGEPNPRTDSSMSGMLLKNRIPLQTEKHTQRKPGYVPTQRGSQYPICNGQSHSVPQGFPKHPETIETQPPLDFMGPSRPISYPPSVPLNNNR